MPVENIYVFSVENLKKNEKSIAEQAFCAATAQRGFLENSLYFTLLCFCLTWESSRMPEGAIAESPALRLLNRSYRSIRMTPIWTEIQQLLEAQLEPGQLKVWIAPLRPAIDGSTLRLTAPGDFIARRVRERFLPLLHAAAKKVMGDDATVELEVAPRTLLTATAADMAKKTSTAKTSSGKASGANGISGILAGSRPGSPFQGSLPVQPGISRPTWNFSFDTFVVGPNNELAHAASKELCRESLATDTLFLCSRPGLGKTHLMQAIGQQLGLEANRPVRIEYLSAEDFANRLIASLKSREMARFKARYREADVLLLEDVHFLQGKEHMQDELLATINALKARGGRVILSSSFAPRELKKFESHLYSRFCSGLVAPIELPDFSMRCRLFSEKARLQHQVLLPEEVTHLLARHIHADIRQIESCLHNLTLKARLLNSVISVEMAMDVIRAYAQEEVIMDFDAIVRTVCKGFKLTPAQLNSRSRKREYVLARNTIFYLARKHTDMSLEEIGSRFSRTHTTVIKGISALEREIQMGTPLGGEIMHTLGLVEKNGRMSFAV